MDNQNNLKGLGGWLILVGIGVVIAPLRLAYGYVPMYYSIFTDGTFEILTTAGTEAYSPLWAPLLIGEAIYNSLMVLASIYLIYLFFSKHYLFPKVYIALIAISVVFVPLDAWAGSFVIIDVPMFDPETTKEFARVLVTAAIWMPYMLMSQRVKATFVEHMPNKSLNPEDSKPILKNWSQNTIISNIIKIFTLTPFFHFSSTYLGVRRSRIRK